MDRRRVGRGLGRDVSRAGDALLRQRAGQASECWDKTLQVEVRLGNGHCFLKRGPGQRQVAALAVDLAEHHERIARRAGADALVLLQRRLGIAMRLIESAQPQIRLGAVEQRERSEVARPRELGGVQARSRARPTPR